MKYMLRWGNYDDLFSNPFLSFCLFLHITKRMLVMFSENIDYISLLGTNILTYASLQTIACPYGGGGGIITNVDLYNSQYMYIECSFWLIDSLKINLKYTVKLTTTCTWDNAKIKDKFWWKLQTLFLYE